VLVTVVAAGKVFLDVLALKGITLLISIFSFGVAAAVASWCWTLGESGRCC